MVVKKRRDGDPDRIERSPATVNRTVRNELSVDESSARTFFKNAIVDKVFQKGKRPSQAGLRE